MELSFIFYLFAAFIIIPGIFFILVLFNKPTAGIIAAIGMLILFILFGIQFFNEDGTYKQTVSDKYKTWPPQINYCPDFLSLFKNGTELMCVDTVGVASTNSGNSLQLFNPNTNTVPTERQMFHLYLTDESINAYKADTNNATKPFDRKSILIEQCQDKKITWEGIFDGLQPLDGKVPVPPS
uniref:Uncharacterized protein n=1 Tax=viral metagenome TaxID=1070528 RepID=A0A6C0D7V2_9ZZZZ